MADIFNIDAEKPFLAETIRDPAILAEVPLTDADFSEVNRVVFRAIRACVASGVEFSEHLLIDRLNSLGIKIGGILEPKDYVNNLMRLKCSRKAAIGLAKEIKRTSIRRQANEIGRRIVAATEKDTHKTAAELVSEVTAVFNEQINLIEGTKESEPKDLFGSAPNLLTHETIFTGRSVPTPFEIFNDMFGFMDAASVSIVASRMKIGKSTFWLSMLQQLAEADADDKLRCLVLDTELTVEENQCRVLSALSGVKEFYIRQRWYEKPKYKHLKPKVEAAAAILEKLKRRVDHHFCGGMSLPDIMSVARRWAFKNLTEGKRGLLVFDYLKLNSGSEFGSKTALFLQIGAKIDGLKNLSKELKIPCLCFAQTNRENVETKAGDKQQNSSVIGGSDMIAQFASNIYLLEKLTPDERMELGQAGPNDATHTLRALACRQLGPNELGEDRLVRYRGKGGKDRYTENYLLFNFDQFRVTEVTTFRKIMEQARTLGAQVQPPPDDNQPQDEIL